LPSKSSDKDLLARVERPAQEPLWRSGPFLDERHSFMHDCESFFWVLFWICIHHDRMNKERRTVQRFDKWNYVDAEELSGMKLGVIADEDFFARQHMNTSQSITNR
jgi:Fungal protein kinase